MSEDLYLERATHDYMSGLLDDDLVRKLGQLSWLTTERLYRYGREAHDQGDRKTALLCESLIRVLCGSRVSTSSSIGEGSTMAYGGIGLLVHYGSTIGTYCTLGTNVTLGAAPVLGDHVYVATGTAIVGTNTRIGNFCVIGANSVVLKDVPPFSVVGGSPAKQLGTITPDNVGRYLSYFCALRKGDVEFVAGVRERFLAEYEQSRA